MQRMTRPHWNAYPAGRTYLRAGGPENGPALAHLGARLMAHDLAAVGINVDCAPVLDVPVPGAHDVIGDRAYGTEPGVVAAFGRAVAEGLMAGGVLPVMKHVPGHGRAAPTATTPCRWSRRAWASSTRTTSSRSGRSPTCRWRCRPTSCSAPSTRRTPRPPPRR